MAYEPLYRRIPEKGKHPANSKRNPGAISGAALDDVTNKPSGSSDFMPVEMTEDEYRRAQQKAVFWGEITQIGLDYASMRFERWWYTKALPDLRYRVYPSVKKKASELWRQIRGKENRNQTQAQAKRSTSQEDTSYTTVALSADLFGAYQNYTVNMTSEEAQKELFEAYVLLYLSMKKIQKLAHARIIDIDGNIINGSEVVNRLSNPAVLRSINRLLSQHPSLLNEWQAAALSQALGRELVQNNQFIPIRRSELIFPSADPTVVK